MGDRGRRFEDGHGIGQGKGHERGHGGWGAVLLGLWLFGLCGSASGQTELDGDVRLYLFGSGESALERQDAELAILRLKLLTFLTDELRFGADGVVALASPPALAGSDLITGGPTRRFFDLTYVFHQDDNVLGVAELDRLYLRWDRPSFRLTAGRQAITWGVNYFWPILDLFAPFSPQQIDRDYKAGVDALRVTVPTGNLSLVDVVLAGQGRELPDDLTLASLGRLNVGFTDLGFMAGSFHTDTVLGSFVTGDAGGTGLRAEIAWTASGDELDVEIDREQFLRASAGLDRQLTPTLFLTAELAWNGYGSDDSADYPRLMLSDRVRRGEVTSLGQRYTGISLNWQVHPLWYLGGALLTNWSDGSNLLQPVATWSATAEISVLIGLIVGFGDDLDSEGRPRSEYGSVPVTLWVAGKLYF